MSSEPPADPWGERLPRRLGLGSAIGLLIANSIGSGIFRVPATVAGALEHTGPILLAWTVGGVLTLSAALSLAEPVAAIPRSGGLFLILHTAYGPVPAFVLGVAEVPVIAPAGLAAVATIFAAYLGHFVALSGRRAVPGGRRHAGASASPTISGCAAPRRSPTLHARQVWRASAAGRARLRGCPWRDGRSPTIRGSPAPRRRCRRGAGADHVHLRGLGRPLRVAGEVRDPARSLPAPWGSAWRSW
jgi:hypothetical protein